jgi:hypothetical protein
MRCYIGFFFDDMVKNLLRKIEEGFHEREFRNPIAGPSATAARPIGQSSSSVAHAFTLKWAGPRREAGWPIGEASHIKALTREQARGTIPVHASHIKFGSGPCARMGRRCDW